MQYNLKVRTVDGDLPSMTMDGKELQNVADSLEAGKGFSVKSDNGNHLVIVPAGVTKLAEADAAQETQG